jgi:hypothetical protein
MNAHAIGACAIALCGVFWWLHRENEKGGVKKARCLLVVSLRCCVTTLHLRYRATALPQAKEKAKAKGKARMEEGDISNPHLQAIHGRILLALEESLARHEPRKAAELRRQRATAGHEVDEANIASTSQTVSVAHNKVK